MIVARQQVIVPFTIQSIYLVSTFLFTFEAISEMVCKHKNISKLLIQLPIEDKGFFFEILHHSDGVSGC